ncbi:NAD(P)-binding domain-containing protein (plasmid) [Rhizobium leguminosarum bv. trifolii]|nr:NAD(P)-binding domain-containing protein [Rhizobium leguminosarum bv. trifolii]
MTEFSSPGALRIAVIGLGGIGSTFAFHLARTGGHDVTVVARPGSARLEQLVADKGIISVTGEHAAVGVTDALDEDLPFDLVIVTLLAHQVDAVLPALTRSAAKDILFMFNNFDPERLRDAIGAERSGFGMPFVQASFAADGRLKAVVGAAGQKTKLSDQRWVDLFARAGLPAVLETNMLLWLRCHAPLCVAFESISIAGVRRGTGASLREVLVIARGIHESFKVIKGLGYALYPSGKVWLDRSPNVIVAGMLWSVSRIRSFRELLATGANECRALVDTIAAAAPRSNQSIAVSEILAMKPSES